MFVLFFFYSSKKKGLMYEKIRFTSSCLTEIKSRESVTYEISSVSGIRLLSFLYEMLITILPKDSK